MISYPSGEITPLGADILLKRVEPLIIYRSHDGNIQWCLSGGLAPMSGVQAGAFLVDGAKGLHPPFQHIDHQGGRQHGVTHQRTVYDPGEIEILVEFTVPENYNNPDVAAAQMRKLIRDWFASWDPENPGTLYYITPEMGVWQCRPRMLRTPPDSQFRAQAYRLRQRYTWSIRNDAAFWQGVDSVSDFRLSFNTVTDNFNRDDAGDLGPQWQQTYTGAGAGVCETNEYTVLFGNHVGYAGWTPSGTVAREVRNRFLGLSEVQTVNINGVFSGGTFSLIVNGELANIPFDADAATLQAALEGLPSVAPGDVSVTGDGPYELTFLNNLGFQNVTTTANGSNLTPGGQITSASVATKVDGVGGTSESDNQIITVKIGEIHQWPFSDQALDIWARMDDNDASPTALRCRLGVNTVTLSRFNAGVETVIEPEPWPLPFLALLIPPLWWEEFSFECGTASNAREYVLKRNGFPIIKWKETGTGSALGASNRGMGWGLRAGDGTTAQDVPASVDEWSAGDNVVATQSGHLNLTNFGSQKGYPRFLAYGPFEKIRIANGPTEFVEFGPLADKQIALITTHPRVRGVVDLTPDQPEQELTEFQDFISRLISLATNNNVPPLLEWFESLLGILPPQGEMYSLLKGRFTELIAIPPKPTGLPPETVSIPVEIVGGDSNAKIIAALTPQRRWPE